MIRVAAKLYMISAVIACIGLAIALAQRDWAALIAYFIVLAGVVLLRGSVLLIVASLLALGSSVVTNAWLGVAAAVLLFMSSVGIWLRTQRVIGRGTKEIESAQAELRQAVGLFKDALPPNLGQSEVNGQLVNSLSLVRAAVGADPYRWRSVAVTEPGHLSTEGGELAGTGWTIIAAEAAHLALHLPRESSRHDIHDLAIAAILLPGSNAQRATGAGTGNAEAALQTAGLSTAAAIQAMSKAARTPGGSLILPRLKTITAGRPLSAARLPFGDWREPPNPARIAPSRRTVTEARTKVGDQPLSARSSVPEGASQPPSGEGRAPAPVHDRRDLAPQTTGRPADARPRVQHHSFRADVAGPALRAWRPSARFLWWGLRPLMTALAVVACAVSARPGVSPLLAAGFAVLVVSVRPVRRLWTGLALAALLWFPSPLAAAAVAARTLVTYVALVLNGPGRSAGIERLVESRQRVTGVPDIDHAWASVEEHFAQPQELELIASLAEVLVAAWCEADAKRLSREAGKLARGFFLGDWPFGRLPSAEILLLRMGMVESVTSGLFRVAAALSGAALGLFLPGVEGLHLFGHNVSRVAAVILGGAAGWSYAALRPATLVRSLPSKLLGLAILSAAAYLLLGIPGLWVVLASMTLGVVFGLTNSRIARPRLAPRPEVPRLPIGLRWRKGHGEWQAARMAKIAGNNEAADRIWRQLATGSVPAHSQTAALGQAMIADLALGRGAWQEAVHWAGAAVEAAPGSSRASYVTRAVGARVMLAAGSPKQSLLLLREAESTGSARRLRSDPVTRMVLARALAMTGDVKAAFDVLSRIRVGVRGVGFGPMIESEALVATMSGPADATAAAERLRSMLEWVEDPQLSEAAESLDDQQRLATAAARARLALGDLELRLGHSGTAESILRRTVKDLPVPAETANRATAQILLGCALGARRNSGESVGQIDEGLSALEAARGQLRDALLRSQLVLQLDDVYSRALDALMVQQQMFPRAGRAAAVLLESRRRDALASLLRRGGGLNLSPKARAIQEEINELEKLASATGEQTEQLAALRSQLSHEISILYAEAYSPDAVTLADLRQRAGDAHILSFKITQADEDCVRGHSVWIPPGGEPFIAEVRVTDPRLLEAIGTRGQATMYALMKEPQFPGDTEYQRWLDLAAALLPEPLRTDLARATRAQPDRVVIVPDGPLAAFPWAGLRITGGRHLIEVAIIHVIPAVSLIDSHEPSMPKIPATALAGHQVMLHSGVEAQDRTLALLSTVCEVREADSRAEIESVLAAGTLVGAYFAAHGGKQGLDQNLELHGGAQISAASALALPWPEWVIFASCIVGSMTISAGTEPTGLVTSCLLGGAFSVVAGVVEVHSGVADDRLCVPLAARLVNGWHPADALRQAQLSFIESRGSASVHRWGGYICVSRLPLPRLSAPPVMPGNDRASRRTAVGVPASHRASRSEGD